MVSQYALKKDPMCVRVDVCVDGFPMRVWVCVSPSACLSVRLFFRPYKKRLPKYEGVRKDLGSVVRYRLLFE